MVRLPRSSRGQRCSRWRSLASKQRGALALASGLSADGRRRLLARAQAVRTEMREETRELAPLCEGAGPRAEADLDLATVARVCHNPEPEDGMREHGPGLKSLLCGIGPSIIGPASGKELVIARGPRTRARSRALALGLFAWRPRTESVLLLASVAVHTANLAVDDRMDSVGENELAPVAPGVDVAPDGVDGHGHSVLSVRDELRL